MSQFPGDSGTVFVSGDIADLVRQVHESEGSVTAGALQAEADDSLRRLCPAYADAIIAAVVNDLAERPPGSALVLAPTVASRYATALCDGSLNPEQLAELLRMLEPGAVDEVARAVTAACPNGPALADALRQAAAS